MSFSAAVKAKHGQVIDIMEEAQAARGRLTVIASHRASYYSADLPAPPLAAARERILVLIKESLDLPLEFDERKWLDDVVVASSINTSLNIGGLKHCRGREDRNIRSVRICA